MTERLHAVAEPDEWLPIETFPYEEEITVDLYVEYRRYADCIWLPDKEAWAVELPTSRGEFIRMENFEPTHWRPVPPPPAVSEEGERLRAVAEAAEWRPIETAPRDGTMVWVYTAPIGPPKISGYLAGFQCPCAYHPDAGWCTDELREVTHWVPLECVDLAPPPAVSQGGGE